MENSLCYTVETNNIISNYTPIKINLKIKKKRIKVFPGQSKYKLHFEKNPSKPQGVVW